MSPEVSGYNLYMKKGLRATVALLRLYQEFPGAIYAYEALTADPAIALPRLMRALDLVFSDQQLDYLRHFSPDQVRGDISNSLSTTALRQKLQNFCCYDNAVNRS